MKKKSVFQVLLFSCLSAPLVYWAWARSLPDKKDFSFDGPGFVQEQESLLSNLAGECSNPPQGRSRRCALWSTFSLAWDSRWKPQAREWIDQSCFEGSAVGCRRREKILAAEQDQQSIWLKPKVTRQQGQAWPVITEVPGAPNIRSWLDIGIAGTVHGHVAQTDLICGALAEIQETLVCVSNGNKELNDALGRIVTYVEHSQRYLSLKEHAENRMKRFWQGVDLKRDDFEQAAALIRARGPLLPEEERLWDWLLARKWKYILAFNSYSVFTGVPSHEFLHGLYFSSAAFRDAVKAVVAREENHLLDVRQFVSRMFDTRDPYILTNEVQASLLQAESMFSDRVSNEVRLRVADELEESILGLNLAIYRQGD